ncbi:hypothetical protein [Kibdelosporangium aridum]|uniref:DUF2690 domain-containing protein n=1 Tax=Kibdelosporangium aridum TaxID=2030 RepID=A0A1W2EXV8_KIBAR|nr:hypothetical protein [Kibdelosporangium aridum]SMD14529.1 hypothetical protein SAMN05661093_05062 [Kibdelosporangium aridum]
MSDDWPKDDLVAALGEIITIKSGHSKPPPYHFPRAQVISDVVTDRLDLATVATGAKRGDLVEGFLRTAIAVGIEVADKNEQRKNLNSARELLGFSRYSEAQIHEIVQRHRPILPNPEAGNTPDSKGVRLHLAKLEQLDDAQREDAILQANPPIMRHEAARLAQKEVWIPLIVDALYDLLHNYRDRALTLAQDLKLVPTNASNSVLAAADPPDVPVTTTKEGPRRRIRSIRDAVGVVIVVGATIATISFMSNPDTPGSNQPAAAELEARYDGKDPRGFDGANSRCAEPPPSQLVQASSPLVMGPEGRPVGNIQLRTSPICPVIWGRVLWNGNETDLYQIPAGWTLHVVGHRPDTKSRFDFPEPSSPTPIQYGLGPMVVTLRGCVYVEAYFSNGDQQTSPSKTSCVMAPKS